MKEQLLKLSNFKRNIANTTTSASSSEIEPISPTQFASQKISSTNIQPIIIEPIGTPVYLSAITQLISMAFLIYHNQSYQASVSFFGFAFFVFTVHCVYSGKEGIPGRSPLLCQSFSYLLILMPILNLLFLFGPRYLKRIKFSFKYLDEDKANIPKCYPYFQNENTENIKNEKSKKKEYPSKKNVKNNKNNNNNSDSDSDSDSDDDNKEKCAAK